MTSTYNIQRHNPETGMWQGLFLWEGKENKEVAMAAFYAIKEVSTQRIRLVKSTHDTEVIEEWTGKND